MGKYLVIIHEFVLWHFTACANVNLCAGHEAKLHAHRVKLYRMVGIESGLAVAKALA